MCPYFDKVSCFDGIGEYNGCRLADSREIQSLTEAMRQQLGLNIVRDCCQNRIRPDTYEECPIYKARGKW